MGHNFLDALPPSRPVAQGGLGGCEDLSYYSKQGANGFRRERALEEWPRAVFWEDALQEGFLAGGASGYPYSKCTAVGHLRSCKGTLGPLILLHYSFIMA